MLRVYIMLWPNFPESTMDQETESEENNQVIRTIHEESCQQAHSVA